MRSKFTTSREKRWNGAFALQRKPSLVPSVPNRVVRRVPSVGVLPIERRRMVHLVEGRPARLGPIRRVESGAVLTDCRLDKEPSARTPGVFCCAHDEPFLFTAGNFRIRPRIPYAVPYSPASSLPKFRGRVLARRIADGELVEGRALARRPLSASVRRWTPLSAVVRTHLRRPPPPPRSALRDKRGMRASLGRSLGRQHWPPWLLQLQARAIVSGGSVPHHVARRAFDYRSTNARRMTAFY
jgi:hypothetical protein